MIPTATTAHLQSNEGILTDTEDCDKSNINNSKSGDLVFDDFCPDPLVTGLYQFCLECMRFSKIDKEDVLFSTNCAKIIFSSLEKKKKNIQLSKFCNDYLSRRNLYNNFDSCESNLDIRNAGIAFFENTFLHDASLSTSDFPRQLDFSWSDDPKLQFFDGWTPLLMACFLYSTNSSISRDGPSFSETTSPYTNQSSKSVDIISKILSKDPMAINIPLQRYSDFDLSVKVNIHFPITIAASMGSYKIFKFLLNQPHSPVVDTMVHCFGGNLWHFAVSGINLQIINEIANLPDGKRPDVTDINEKKQNIYHLSCQEERFPKNQLFQRIRELSWKLVSESNCLKLANSLDIFNRSPLHYASESGNPRAVQFLCGVMDPPQSLNFRDVFGHSPLQIAIYSIPKYVYNLDGSYSIVNLLAAAGVNSQRDFETNLLPRDSFLIEAEKLKNQDWNPLLGCDGRYLTKQLLSRLIVIRKKRGWYVQRQSYHFNWLTKKITLFDLVNTINLLKENEHFNLKDVESSYQNSVLHESIYRDCSSQVICFLAHMFQTQFKNLDILGYLGSTPIHLLPKRSRANILKYLLKDSDIFPPEEIPQYDFDLGDLELDYDIDMDSKFVVDIDAKDFLGSTLLHIIAKKGSVDCFEQIFSSSSISLDDPDIFGKTPVWISVFKSNYPVMEWILTQYPELIHSKEKSHGETLLHAAVSFSTDVNEFPFVEFLLDHGADPEIRDEFQRLPIHKAAQYSTVGNVQALYDEFPESINSQAYFGYTPLWCAIEQENSATLQFLVKHSDFTHVDAKGRSLLHHVAIFTTIDSDLELLQSCINLFDPENLKKLDSNSQTPLDLAKRFKNVFMIRKLQKLVFDSSSSSSSSFYSNSGDARQTDRYRQPVAIQKRPRFRSNPNALSWGRGKPDTAE